VVVQGAVGVVVHGVVGVVVQGSEVTVCLQVLQAVIVVVTSG
jgi:hypothetical protein